MLQTETSGFVKTCHEHVPGLGFWLASSNRTPFAFLGLEISLLFCFLFVKSLLNQSMIISRISSPLRQLQRASTMVIRVAEFSREGYQYTTQKKSLNFENWCSGGKLSKIGHHF